MQIWVKVKDNLPLTQEDPKPSRAETQTNHKALERQAKPQIWGSGEILRDQSIKRRFPKWAADKRGQGARTGRPMLQVTHTALHEGLSGQPAGRRPRTPGTSPTGKWTGEVARWGAGPVTISPPPATLRPSRGTGILMTAQKSCPLQARSVSPEGRMRVLGKWGWGWGGGQVGTSVQSPVKKHPENLAAAAPALLPQCQASGTTAGRAGCSLTAGPQGVAGGCWPSGVRRRDRQRLGRQRFQPRGRG